MMRTLENLFAAGTAILTVTLMSSAARAADMPLPPPPIPVVEDFGGWYLRGDIGFSNQAVKEREYSSYSTLTSLSQTTGFNSAGIFGLGAGYQFNNWFRMDVTGEYRAKSNFTGTDILTYDAYGLPFNGSDQYSGSKSEWLVLANAYVDLGTWWGITPFIGAGVGAARVTISGFTDQGLTNLVPDGAGGAFYGASPGLAFANEASRWNLAWAVHAGLGYRITPSLTMELAYRYVNMGDGYTGNLTSYDGYTANQPMKFKDITSHDLKVGLRWALGPMPGYGGGSYYR